MVEYFSKGLEAQPMDFLAFQGVGNAASDFFSFSKGLEMQPVAFFGFPRG